MSYFDPGYFDPGFFSGPEPALGLLSEGDYFSSAYFDPTYFATDSAPEPVIQAPVGGPRWRRLISVPEPAPLFVFDTDDEQFALLFT